MANQRDHWTFFSNHGHVYFLLARDPHMVLRQVADQVGITERAVQGIVQDLEAAGYIRREKVGRSNIYHIVADTTLRHPLETNVLLSDLCKLLQKGRKRSRPLEQSN